MTNKLEREDEKGIYMRWDDCDTKLQDENEINQVIEYCRGKYIKYNILYITVRSIESYINHKGLGTIIKLQDESIEVQYMAVRVTI